MMTPMNACDSMSDIRVSNFPSRRTSISLQPNEVGKIINGYWSQGSCSYGNWTLSQTGIPTRAGLARDKAVVSIASGSTTG